MDRFNFAVKEPNVPDGGSEYTLFRLFPSGVALTINNLIQHAPSGRHRCELCVDVVPQSYLG